MRFSFVFGLGLLLLPLGGCFAEPADALEASDASTGPSTGGPGGSGVVSASEGASTDLTDTAEAGTTGSGGTGVATWVGSSSEGDASGSGTFGGSGTGSSTGDDSAVCGNGVQEAGEACDDGPKPPLSAGACRPDCSGPIPTRTVRLSPSSTLGDLGSAPVETMDGLCPAGTLALFAFADIRRATEFPNELHNPVDWVLHPYTAYVNAQGDTIWVTDSVPLLGVRDGVANQLLHPIVPFEDNPPSAVTGMNADWTVADGPDQNCMVWTSESAADLHSSGVPWIVDAGAFLNNGAFGGCDQPGRAYCVEQ